MICERCGKEHDGSFASGRFCSKSCANKRIHSKETKNRISETLSKKGIHPSKDSFKKRYSDKEKEEMSRRQLDKWGSIILEKANRGEYVKSQTITKYILEEQGNKCDICKMSPIWNCKEISFDLDHIDGNSSNHYRKNLRVICPNCHRQTETFGSKNIGNGIPRKNLKKYLKHKEIAKILTKKRLLELGVDDS